MSAVSSHDTGLFDVVLVRRPKRWRPRNTHEVPPKSNVVSVELFGVSEIVAEDLLVEINSSDWLKEWAIMLPHVERKPITDKRRSPRPVLSIGIHVTTSELASMLPLVAPQEGGVR